MAARRPAHKVAHDPCPFGATTWGDCEKAAQEARGRCVSLTQAETECTNWAVDEFEGRGYCGQHYAARVNEAKVQAREAARRAALLIRIDQSLAFQKEHPSVWCRMPEGWRPGDPVPDCPCPANPVPVSRPRRAGVVWSASSGVPLR